MKKQTETMIQYDRRITMSLISRFTRSIHREGFCYTEINVEREISSVLGMVILGFNLELIDDAETMRANSYLYALRNLFRDEMEKHGHREAQIRFGHHLR